MMNCVKSPVVPLGMMSSCVGMYSEEWYRDYVLGATDVAVDDMEDRLPFCTVLSLYGGNVEDLFEVKDWVKWKLSIVTFRSDEDMDDWMEGKDVIDVVYLRDNKQLIIN